MISQQPPVNYFAEYTAYFSRTSKPEEPSLPTTISDISYDPHSPNIGTKVLPLHAQRRGALASFRVDVGPFTVQLKMLLIGKKCTSSGRHQLYNSRNISILQLYSQHGRYVAKRTYFTSSMKLLKFSEHGESWEVEGTPSEIQQILRECAIGKVCDVLGVGVKVGSPEHPFDVVCYENCAEFFMEKGTAVNSMQHGLSLSKIEQSLKRCVQILHKYGIIHKDIKPDNILVGEDGKAVFADFGISDHVGEVPGQATFTFREGTPFYMSPAMKALKHSGGGDVDLFHNDMWGLRMSITKIAETPQSKGVPAALPRLNPSDEDLAVVGLAATLFPVRYDCATPEALILASKQFRSYFKQFGGEVAEKDYKVEFVAKAFGAPRSMLFYLTQLPSPTPRCRRLIERLLRTINNPSLFKLEGLCKHSALLRIFHNAFLEDDVEEIKEELCQAGFKLLKKFLRDQHYQEARDIITRIEPLANGEPATVNRFRIEKLSTQLLSARPNESQMHELLSSIKQHQRLVQTLRLAFSRNANSIALGVLALLLPKCPTIHQPTPEDVIDILFRNLQEERIDNQFLRKLIKAYSGMSFRLYRLQRRELRLLRYSQQFPAKIQLELALMEMVALQEILPKEQKERVFKEVELCASGLPEHSKPRIRSTILRCDKLIYLGMVEARTLRQPILSCLEFIEAALDCEFLRRTCYKILSDIGYLEQRFTVFFDYSVRMFESLQQEEPFERHFDYVSMVACRAQRLVGLAGREGVPESRIHEMTAMLEEFVACATHSSEATDFDFDFFQAEISLSCIHYFYRHTAKEQQWSRRAVRKVEPLPSDKIALRYVDCLVRIYEYQSRASTPPTLLECSRKLINGLSGSVEEVSLFECFQLCRLAMKFAWVAGHSQATDVLLGGVLFRLRRDGFPAVHDGGMLELASRALNNNCESYAVEFAMLVVGRCSQAAAIAAKCLYKLNRQDECELAALRYLEAPLADNMTMWVHNVLRMIHSKKNKREASQHHLAALMKLLKTHYRSLAFDHQIPLNVLLDMSAQTYHRELYLRCVCWALRLATDPNSQRAKRSWLFESVGMASNRCGHHALALQCLRSTPAGARYSSNSPAPNLVLAYCSLVMRKPRTYYQAASGRVLFPELVGMLADMLLQRREYIKYYLLAGVFPQGCGFLAELPKLLEAGLPRNFGTEPTRKRLQKLVFAKRMRCQALRYGRNNTKNMKLIVILDTVFSERTKAGL